MTWQEHFERYKERKKLHLIVFCAIINPLAIMRLSNEMEGSEHNVEAKKAVARANFWCQQMLEATDYKEPAGSTIY